MADRAETGELLRRALAYPYAAPPRSFVQRGSETLELPPELDLSERRPLLAYGSNAAPETLARKLALDPQTPLPLLRAELSDYDVVFSAHVSPHGSVPATLQHSPGTVVTVFLAYATAEQLRLLAATEPNYELRTLALACRPERGEPPPALDVFLSRHGCLALDGAEAALAAVPARGRRFPALSQRQALEWVRDAVCPGRDLGEFVAGPEAQTAAKRLSAKRAIVP